MPHAIFFGYLMTLAMLGLSFSAARFLPHIPASANQSGRIGYIDGLRGFLALSVLSHHFVIAWIYAATGKGVVPDDTVFANLGPAAVIIFFMITGFLFYGKLVDSSGHLNLRSFYLNRLFRLCPSYWLTILIFIIILSSDHPIDPRSLIHSSASLLNWFTFTFFGGYTELFGINTRDSFFGVVWTLRYEWLFYIGLPILALFVRFGPKVALYRSMALCGLIVVISAAPAVTFHSFSIQLLTPFLWGMLASEVARSGRAGLTLKGMPAAGLALGLVVLELWWFKAPFGFFQTAYLFPLFLIVACGNPVFGLVSDRRSITLGDASYSIYLLHALVLHLMFDVVPKDVAALDNVLIWLLMPLAGLLVSGVACLVYVKLEYPAILLGRTKSRRKRPVDELEQVAP